MGDFTARFQHDSDLIDILWRQDVDLGVEREIFDGCLRQREEEIMRARTRERERELEKIMQRLRKLDKETGEFVPSPSSVNFQAVSFSEMLPSTTSTQCSPVTQNPLLSALLFSQKSQKLPSQDQALSELASLPDLQYYLDVLESESSSLPLEDISEICQHNLPIPQREDALCCVSELTQTLSDSFSCIPSDPTEVLEPLSDPSNPTLSPSDPIYTSDTPENQAILPKCQINDSVLNEFCSDLNAYAVNPEQLNSAPVRNAPQTLSQFKGFDDSASVSSVDLETSLYDSFSNEQSDKDELESIQSDYTDLLSLPLDSETSDATLYESVEQQAQNTSLTSTKRGAGVRRTCRDEQRARALSLPLSIHDIIHLPVEAFNEAISSCKLNHAQHTLIRDIRRRGKNKMAAQSCRKRKLDSLFSLEDEIEVLKREKDQCLEEKERSTRELCEMKEKLGKVYNEVFRQLKDEHGNSYNPREYKLQLSTDGTVYLLPRTTAHKSKTLTEDLTIAL